MNDCRSDLSLVNISDSDSDLKRAFDTVWREGLFHKLKSFDINGRCYNRIKNIYLDIKSCVKVNGERSMLFPCDIGVRQGGTCHVCYFL